MAHADPFPLDHIHSHRSRVQEDVCDMVVKEIDLIDIQDAAICCGKDSGFKCPYPFLYRFLDVKRANDPILRTTERQIDDSPLSGHDIEFSTIRRSLVADVAHLIRVIRIAIKRAVPDHLDLGEQFCKSSNRCRLCSPFFAPY